MLDSFNFVISRENEAPDGILSETKKPQFTIIVMSPRRRFTRSLIVGMRSIYLTKGGNNHHCII